MLVKNTISANQIPIFNNFFKKPMKFTGIIPDTLLETIELLQPMTKSYGRCSVCFQAATSYLEQFAKHTSY